MRLTSPNPLKNQWFQIFTAVLSNGFNDETVEFSSDVTSQVFLLMNFLYFFVFDRCCQVSEPCALWKSLDLFCRLPSNSRSRATSFLSLRSFCRLGNPKLVGRSLTQCFTVTICNGGARVRRVFFSGVSLWHVMYPKHGSALLGRSGATGWTLSRRCGHTEAQTTLRVL